MLAEIPAIDKLGPSKGDGPCGGAVSLKIKLLRCFPSTEAGLKTKELCRKHGISDATFYKWKAKFGGMTVPETARLRSLEDENRRLKKLLAESVLDNAVLKDLLRKN